MNEACWDRIKDSEIDVGIEPKTVSALSSGSVKRSML